jgi:hypothetical protein
MKAAIVIVASLIFQASAHAQQGCHFLIDVAGLGPGSAPIKYTCPSIQPGQRTDISFIGMINHQEWGEVIRQGKKEECSFQIRLKVENKPDDKDEQAVFTSDRPDCALYAGVKMSSLGNWGELSVTQCKGSGGDGSACRLQGTLVFKPE